LSRQTINVVFCICIERLDSIRPCCDLVSVVAFIGSSRTSYPDLDPGDPVGRKVAFLHVR
jgi:hypothetical protein